MLLLFGRVRFNWGVLMVGDLKDSEEFTAWEDYRDNAASTNGMRVSYMKVMWLLSRFQFLDTRRETKPG